MTAVVARNNARVKASKSAEVSPIKGYLATVPTDRCALLEQLRRVIRRAVPSARECISYAMPAFRVEGGVVAGFAVTKTGASYYPFSGQTLDGMAAELNGYSRTKSALHFSAERPLSVALVRKLIAARMAEIESSPRNRRARR
jgi:uncharacterized protein YdhG (YjbR/CyaY superfamily)